MPHQKSRDALISQKASEFAEHLRNTASIADKEEEIRIAAERQLGFLEKEAGIKLEGRHEFTVASGRVDSVYDRVIIEYKNPSSPADRIGSSAGSPGCKKVIDQIKKRFYDLRAELGHGLNTLFGVGLDGNSFVFVRYRDDRWQVQDPVEVNQHSSERFLWALMNIGQKGRPFAPEQLARDFGSESASARAGITALYAAITTTAHPKARTFFNQWKILFSEVCGYDIEKQSDKMDALAESYGIDTKTLKPAELLFALHSYYAIFMKLLAAEIVAFFHHLPTPLEKMLRAVTSNKLKSELQELEAGSIFRHLNITNFLEGDLFAWYLPVWSDPIDKLFREMVAQLDNYNPGTLSEDPAGSRDLLKRLYQQLFPQSVRHDLGEYYTPDWLAEHVLDELEYTGDPDKRLLDPACGSGTFLVLAVNRIKSWFTNNREQCRFDEGDLCRKILKNVVGFDLNPIAVMAARTNYLIALRDLIGHVDEVEIPIYLCDSIVTPTEYGDLFTGTAKVAKIPCAACQPPHLLVPKEIAATAENVAKYARLIEHHLATQSTADQFLAGCRDEALPTSEAELHRALFTEILALDEAHKNGVWARIIKNAFAPLFAGKFDFVAGNPPWVNWENLPSEYRTLSEHIWVEYSLVGPVPIKKRQQSDAAKTDVSILMTYVAIDKYLNRSGSVGFVLPRTIFQSELGGWHFRAFSLPGGVKFKVSVVHDWDSIKPFRGQAANNACTAFFRRDQKISYPVPWVSYRSKGGSTISEDTDWVTVRGSVKRLNWVARPIDSAQPQSPWIFGAKRGMAVAYSILGASFYSSRAREGINTRGANGIYFLNASLVRNRLWISNRCDDGDDPRLPVREQAIEHEYVYPLLRGKDVGRWTAVPSSYILLPHDAENPNDPVPFSELPDKTKEYLAFFRSRLAKRKPFRNFDPTSGAWHGLYSVLTATFAPYKVVWREMATGSVAAVTGSSTIPSGEQKIVVPDHKLFVIPCATEAEAQFVCGFFNSSIASYIISSYAISTGISTHVLERLPIPRFDATIKSHRAIVDWARKCHEATLSGGGESFQDELDKAVGGSLALSDADVEIVREALSELG
jgi:hypothetical protein